MCWPEVAPHLTSHPSIAHITFIGSRPVAHHVARSASKTLTPLCIELGGKDAAIILNDAKNLSSIASIMMRGTFQSCGQNCVGIERIIALPKVYPKLISLLENRVKNLRLGSILDDEGVDAGALISDAGFDRLENLIQDAVKQGARLLAGGKRYNHPKHPKGHYFSPTLLVDVTPSMAIAQNEVFAPICLIMPAETTAHAVEIANSTMYSLGGSVFGSNQRDLEYVTKHMKSGMVSVNDFAVYYMNQSLPFGGCRGSGYGRFAGPEGLRSVCNLKAVAKDKSRFIGTSIPPTIDYPIKNGDRAWAFVKGEYFFFLLSFLCRGTSMLTIYLCLPCRFDPDWIRRNTRTEGEGRVGLADQPVKAKKRKHEVARLARGFDFTRYPGGILAP